MAPTAAAAGQDVRKRWLLLAVALLLGLAAAFAIGTAVKSSDSTPAAGSLVHSTQAQGRRAVITPPAGAGAVPALRTPVKKKVATSASASTTASPATSPQVSATQAQTTPVQTQTTPQPQTTPQTQTHTTAQTTTGISGGGGG